MGLGSGSGYSGRTTRAPFFQESKKKKVGDLGGGKGGLYIVLYIQVHTVVVTQKPPREHFIFPLPHPFHPPPAKKRKKSGKTHTTWMVEMGLTKRTQKEKKRKKNKRETKMESWMGGKGGTFGGGGRAGFYI